MFPTKKGNTKGDARAKVSLPKEMEGGKEVTMYYFYPDWRKTTLLELY